MSADLGVAVEVVLDDLLGQLDRQLGDPALQVAHRPLGGETDVLRGPGAELGDLAVDRRDALLAHLLGRLPGLLDDLARLVARVGELLAVLVERGLGFDARLLRPFEVVADAVLAVLERLLDRRPGLPRQEPEDDHERDDRPDDLLAFRQDRVLRLDFLGSASEQVQRTRDPPLALGEEEEHETEQGERLGERDTEEHRGSDVPCISGWRAIAWIALPTTRPMPMPGPMAAAP